MRRIRILLRLLVVLPPLVAPAKAGPVYECRDGGVVVAWQDRPCAASQHQAAVAIAPSPPPAPSPSYGTAAAGAGKSAPDRRSSGRGGPVPAEARSWECRAANGEVFYRHGSCPKSLERDGAGRGAGPARVAVAATPLPRAEACRRMAAERGRSGRGRDERAPTYERNLGRDPCRRP